MLRNTLWIVVFFLLPTVTFSDTTTVLWREPTDIRTRNLFYGPGGEEGQPKGPFRFIEEDRDGTSPKFVVADSQGVLWTVKLGPEAQPETASTRLVWAVGYFADVTYYLPAFTVADLPKLRRGQQYVSADGVIRGARFERIEKDVKKVGNWSWFENPFLNTKEFNGLRVMMALLNNWDLKESNNAIYEIQGNERRYLVSDLGATFGRTGGSLTHSEGNLKHYLSSKFIEEREAEKLDLVLDSRPPILYAFAVPYYVKQTQIEKIAEDIPRDHAKWIGALLAQLADEQIKDAFRAAGYAPEETHLYAQKVRERIRQLTSL